MESGGEWRGVESGGENRQEWRVEGSGEEWRVEGESREEWRVEYLKDNEFLTITSRIFSVIFFVDTTRVAICNMRNKKAKLDLSFSGKEKIGAPQQLQSICTLQCAHSQLQSITVQCAHSQLQSITVQCAHSQL